jgi:hypothetical protein|tara:strand:- start:3320 stop:4069 length:750 start_codon:yes stop_codon:yes gene_type:complete
MARPKKAKTTVAQRRGFLTRSKKTKRRTSPSRFTRNLAYFTNEAPLFKLLGIGLAIYGINQVVGAIKGDDPEPRKDPIDTSAKGGDVVNIMQYYNNNEGEWAELGSFFTGAFDDDKYFFVPPKSQGGTTYFQDVPPQSSQILIPYQSKTINNVAGEILGYFLSSIDWDTLSNVSICQFCNVGLSIALNFTDDEVKAFYNSCLSLTARGKENIGELLKESQAYVEDSSQLPFSRVITLLQARLVDVGMYS